MRVPTIASNRRPRPTPFITRFPKIFIRSTSVFPSLFSFCICSYDKQFLLPRHSIEFSSLRTFSPIVSSIFYRRTETMAAAGKAVKTKLFIGNLDPATQSCNINQWISFNTIEFFCFLLRLAELNELFSSYGAVLEASVIKDYGFVVKLRVKRSIQSKIRFCFHSISEVLKKQKKQWLV